MPKIINNYLSLFDKEDKFYYFVILVLTFLTVCLETLSIGLILPLMQILVADQKGLESIVILSFFNLENFSKEKLFLISIVSLATIYTLKAIFLTLFSYLEHDFLSKVKVNLSKKLFSIYLYKPYLFHVETNSSQLVRNLIDLKRFSAVMRESSSFLTEVLVLISILCLLIYFEPWGAIGSLILFSTFAILFYFKIQKNARKWGEQRQIYQGYQIKNMNDCFRAIKEIKVFGKESFFIKEFVLNSKIEIENDFKKHSFTNSLPRFWFEWITVIGMIFLICLLFASNKSIDVIIPTLALFGAAAFRIVPSVVRIMNSTQKIRFNFPVIENLFLELNRSKDEIKIIDHFENKPNKSKNLDKFNNINIQKINYSYPGSDQKILSNLNFEIKCNSFLGITGKSGSGKTTLVNIMLGLLQPDAGKINIDNNNIANNLKGWKNSIGYVPQNIFLFDDTIKKNIGFGLENHEINENEIFKIIEDVQLKKLVLDSKSGINTKIGEFGDKLSGGQIQRIGIARALYAKPRILIMDESTSALDLETEKKIINELYQFKDKLTVILIAHRNSILDMCDKVIDLDQLKND